MLTTTAGAAAPSTAPDVVPAPDTTPTFEQNGRRTHTCPTCQHVLGVVGLDRHRVYFELSDERLDDPVMNRVCPGCKASLPGK